MSDTPWRSIRDGLVAANPNLLAYHEAKQSPCATCSTTPCCTFVPVHKFNVETFRELDHARYLLNFEHIELTLATNGAWTVYYRYPCRFLDRARHTCSVHDTPTQPRVCVNYEPYGCWYQRVFTQSTPPDCLRLDRRRLEILAAGTRFDEGRRIREMPTWEALVAAFSQEEPEAGVEESEPIAIDEVRRRWKEELTRPPVDEPRKLFTYADLGEPCTGCDAYCCTTLTFPHATPTTRTNFDFIQFCLGYPGIELGVGDDGWNLIVRTRCRHLKGNRCAVYGQPERPLTCRYYDANQCWYKASFGVTRPAKYLRLGYEEFELLTECFGFDEHGDVIQVSTTASIREHVEARLRAGRG